MIGKCLVTKETVDIENKFMLKSNVPINARWDVRGGCARILVSGIPQNVTNITVFAVKK